jgi:hypothetical protein
VYLHGLKFPTARAGDALGVSLHTICRHGVPVWRLPTWHEVQAPGTGRQGQDVRLCVCTGTGDRTSGCVCVLAAGTGRQAVCVYRHRGQDVRDRTSGCVCVVIFLGVACSCLLDVSVARRHAGFSRGCVGLYFPGHKYVWPCGSRCRARSCRHGDL